MRKFHRDLITFLCLAQAGSHAGLSVKDFGASPDDGRDDTPAFIAAFRALQTNSTPEIEIPRGRYHLAPAGDVLNSQVFFPLSHRQNVKIRGNGAELLVRGSAALFAFSDCREILVESLRIDSERPPFSQGTVIAAASNYFDVQIEKEFPVSGGEAVGAFMSYDRAKRLPLGRDLDVYGGVEKTELAGPQILRVYLNRPIAVPVGTFLVLRHEVYGPGAFRFHRCAEIRVNDVTVHCVSGMALTAGVCTNIVLKRFNVVIPPGSGRLMSATADATHFSGCKGNVSLEDCIFEGMGDDGVNIKSGLYLMVRKRLDDHSVVGQHNLKFIDLPDPGDLIEFSHPDTFLPFFTNAVQSAAVEPGPEKLQRLTFKSPLPEAVGPGDLLGNASRVATFQMRRCTVRANRARGVLCQTRGARIEDCTFKNCSGPGVLVLTEATHFYESIGTRDVVVRNNLFEDCNQGAALAEGALCALAWLKNFAYPSVPGVHRDVRIEGNRIIGTTGSGIFAVAVDGLTIRSNLIRQACLPPTDDSRRAAIRVLNSSSVVIKDNDIDPLQQGGPLDIPIRIINTDLVK